MHAGSISTSKRLQETFAALTMSDWVTTAEIQAVTRSQAVHSDIAALRANGHAVITRYAGKSVGGAKVYAYKLVGEQMELAI